MLERCCSTVPKEGFPEESAELMVGVAANCNVRFTAVDVSRPTRSLPANVARSWC